MQKAIALVSFSCLAWAATAAAQAPAAPQHSITHIAGDVYRFQDNQHFGVFMVTPEGVILVDPINLDTANWVKGEITTRFNNAKVVEVLYSHHDWDHASGAAAFPGAKIVSRSETVKDLQPPSAATKLSGGDAAADKNKDGLLQADEVSGARAQDFATIDKDGNGGLSARELFQAQFADVLAPTETYNTAVKKITVGGKAVEMHHLPSMHADDLSLIYFPAEKVLFVVDVVSLKQMFFRTMDDFDEVDMNTAIDKVLSFDATTIVPGHGSVGTKQDVQDVRKYMRELMNGVQAGIVNGKTLRQIQTDLTLDKYKSWGGYADWRTLNIEGMYNYMTK
jgi:glyoxylase-like metal-dependent hydrolase (beta-lactamase superfamily II)